MKHDTSPSAQSPTELTARGIRVGDQHLPLFSGAVHYWRLDPDHWGAVLDAVAALGFRIVETYVPWAVHERGPHNFDFGQGERARDLGRFLDEIWARGLYALVRPGPHINSELTDFGFPARVLANPAIQARTAHDTSAVLPMFPRPFPAPSYASEAFMDEVSGWFGAVMPHIVSRLYPQGPVVSVQVDNEWSYFFRTGLYDLDYSPDALTGYRRFLLERYGDLEAINQAYGIRHSRIEAVEPPRRYSPRDRLVWHLDWARHQSWALLEALRRLKGMLREHLPDTLPLYTNLPPGSEASPFDLSGTEELLDQVGLDLYHTRQELTSVQRAGRYLTAQTRLPSCPEFGTGCFLTWVPTTPEDNQQATLAALMYGVRSFNFYMLVDRERWYGSPIRTSGTAREAQAAFYHRLLEVVDRYALTSRPRKCEAALVRVRLYDRVGAIASLMSPMPPLVMSALGMKTGQLVREGELGDVISTQERWIDDWHKALQVADVDFDLADSEQSLELLKRYRMLVVPSRAKFDRAVAIRLVALAEAGAWVVVGPERPQVDLETGEAIDWPVKGTPTVYGAGWRGWTVGRGCLIEASDPALPPAIDAEGVDGGADVAHVLKGLIEAANLTRSGVLGRGACAEFIHGVRLAPFEGRSELVWVMNSGRETGEARVLGFRALRDVFSGQVFIGAGGDGGAHPGGEGGEDGVIVELEPWSVRLFERVEPSTGGEGR